MEFGMKVQQKIAINNANKIQMLNQTAQNFYNPKNEQIDLINQQRNNYSTGMKGQNIKSPING
jgi:hypothetical protein